MADVVHVRIIYFCRETFMLGFITAYRPVSAQGFSSRTRLAMAVLAAAGIAGLAHAVPTSFNVNDSSAWTTGTGSGANSSVTFGFDYSSLGIPQAPGSATTTALVMRANTNSGAAAVQGITVSPNGVSLTGDYIVKATIWANSYGGWTTGSTLSTGTGTSQMVGLGVGYTGGTLWRGGSGTSAPGGGSGVWFAAAGDGGFGGTSNTIRDYSAFTGSGALLANFVTSTAAYFASGSGTNPQDNNNPYYQAAFPGPLVNSINSGSWASAQGQTLLSGTVTNGIAGMAWREFTIARTGTTVTWSIDTTPIATLGTSVPLDGATSITYFDPTSGVAPNNLVFGLVSSYSVELVPEPTTLGLLAAVAVGIMPLVRRRRRPVA
jgi:hypothetical protein